ncbi:MAG: hypothetical protein AB7F79_01000 [Steroidobacteraceae bacterium]
MAIGGNDLVRYEVDSKTELGYVIALVAFGFLGSESSRLSLCGCQPDMHHA